MHFTVFQPQMYDADGRLQRGGAAAGLDSSAPAGAGTDLTQGTIGSPPPIDPASVPTLHPSAPYVALSRMQAVTPL